MDASRARDAGPGPVPDSYRLNSCREALHPRLADGVPPLGFRSVDAYSRCLNVFFRLGLSYWPKRKLP